MNAPWTDRAPPTAVGTTIYLDNHAITPVDPRVIKAVCQEMFRFRGNPNSTDHLHGVWASERLEAAALSVGKLFGAPPEDVRFTSSATEGLRLALAHAAASQGTRPLQVACSRIEHPALIDMLVQAERSGAVATRWLACDDRAHVPLEAVEQALGAGAGLVCLMAANNEVGTIQALQAVADLVRNWGARLLLDASQGAGRIGLDNARLEAEYLVVSGHKLYGPSGIGAIIGADMAHARWAWPAGGHDPTPNLPGAVGLAEACTLRLAEMSQDEAEIGQLRDRLQGRLLETVAEIVVNGDPTSRLAGNLHISARDAPNDQVVARLRGNVSISTGAACASGADAPSHVLRAMGLPAWRQESALRIGVGKFNTLEEIDAAAEAIAKAISDVRDA